MRAVATPKRSYASAHQREGVMMSTEEDELAPGSRPGKIALYGAHAERRFREKPGLGRAERGQRTLVVRRDDAAGGLPGGVIVGVVAETQIDVAAGEKAKAMRLRHQRIRMVDEAPAFEQQTSPHLCPSPKPCVARVLRRPGCGAAQSRPAPRRPRLEHTRSRAKLGLNRRLRCSAAAPRALTALAG